MVYLYIESIDNPVVIQLENVIENSKLIRLESFTMFNSWNNLVEGSAIILKDNGNNVLSIP